MNNNSGFNQWVANKEKEKIPVGTRLWKTFLWFAIFLSAWWLIGAIMGPKNNAQVADDAPAAAVVDLSTVPVVELSAENINASLQGLRISNVDLKDYKKESGNDAPMRLLADDDTFAEVGMLATGTTAPTATTVWKDLGGGSYSWTNADGVVFNRNVAVDGYVITITDTINNNSSRDISVAPYARIMRSADKKSSAGVYTGMVAYANRDLEHKSWPSLVKRPRAYTTNDGFVGFVDQYWETVASIDAPGQTMRVTPAGDLYSADTAASAIAIAAGDTRDVVSHIYVGPRERGALRAAAGTIAGIHKTIDYGWFWFLARPLAWALNALHSVVGNYGVAIIILTLLLRLLMWPLTRKSYQATAKMQQMQPELTRIQKLYANDKQRLQLEMMRVYQTHKTSPMSGCLPMLIQIPIFFALYKALLVSVQMRNAHFLWIHDLAAMDPYFILPIIMGATMWWQQSLQSVPSNKNPNDPVAQTQRAMKWMPIVFTIMFAWMPAGLVLYWATSNLCGILQMYVIKKRS